jgi:hypothetical protein
MAEKKIRSDMRAKVLASSIQKRLRGNVSIALHPDHPLLFDGPDVLVALPGNLVAIFVLRVAETTNPESLLSRLAVARLALPTNLRCILIVPKIGVREFYDEFVIKQFHEVASDQEPSSVVAFIKDPIALGQVHGVPLDVKTFVFKRFGVFLSQSYDFLDINQKLDEAESYRQSSIIGKKSQNPVEVRSKLMTDLDERQFNPTRLFAWSKRQEVVEPISRRLLSAGRNTVGVVSSNVRGSLSQKIKPLCRDILHASYEFDSGVPYPKIKSANLLVTNSENALTGYDRLKPVRTAAFTGWAISPVSDIDRHLDELHTIQNKLMYVKL